MTIYHLSFNLIKENSPMLNNSHSIIPAFYIIFYYLNVLLFDYFIDHMLVRKYRYSHIYSLCILTFTLIIVFVYLMDIIVLRISLNLSTVFLSCLLFYHGTFSRKVLYTLLSIISFALSKHLHIFSLFMHFILQAIILII